MSAFLVETYVSAVDPGAPSRVVAAVRAATDTLRAEGIEITYVRAHFVPADEMCLLLFEATSRRHVHAAIERGGLQADRISFTIGDDTAPFADVGPDVPESREERDNVTDMRVDAYVAQLEGWKRVAVVRLRALIHEAAPAVTETWKWDTPVFAARTNACAIGVFADHVKVNFFKGASLPDPTGLFNAGLEAKSSRAIDLHEADIGQVDEDAFRELVRAAVAAAS